ncbi:MAG: sigma-70 family RNA polymerase sigma factor [Planctomycetia bacterium]|nr:sigma-70 family RNA polymerase sigma factor [Planctomycetia bacterium]
MALQRNIVGILEMDVATSSAGPARVEGDNARAELLVRLLIRHQQDLFRYIFSLLPNQEDARDALQETSVAIFRKSADYDTAKPFLAWAYGFAYLEVLKARERACRNGRHLREDLFELLARDREKHESELHSRLQALESCLLDLPADDRELIHQRYTIDCPIDELVERLGTSRRTLFRNLDRIRRALFECISRRLAAT